MKKQDNLSIIVNAALAEGLSYGKYMARYNYDPPCIKNPTDSHTAPDKAKRKVTSRRRNEEMRICPWCGESFRTVKRTYCSMTCQQIAATERRKKKSAELTLERKQNAEPRYCVLCGKQIPAERSALATSCSDKCRRIINEKRWSALARRKH